MGLTEKVVIQALLSGDLTACVVAQNWLGNWVPTIDGEPFWLRGNLENIVLPSSLLLNGTVDINDKEATQDTEDTSEIEPDWEALDPYEAMPGHTSTSDNDIDVSDIVMWEDPIRDSEDDLHALVWEQPGNSLCYVLYEFRARGLWCLPTGPIHAVLAASQTDVSAEIDHLFPYDPIIETSQHDRLMSDSGAFWFVEKVKHPSVYRSDIVVP